MIQEARSSHVIKLAMIKVGCAMLCSMCTHQCSYTSLSCATLMHATTVLLINIKGQHHHVMKYIHIVLHHACLQQRDTMLTDQVASHAEGDSQSPKTPTLTQSGDSQGDIGTCKCQTRSPMREVLTLHVLGQTNLTSTIHMKKTFCCMNDKLLMMMIIIIIIIIIIILIMIMCT